MSFTRGQKIRLLTKQGQSLEGWVLSFSSKEIWLQNEKSEMVWIPSPYENVGLVKILVEEQIKQRGGPYRTIEKELTSLEEYDSESEEIMDDDVHMVGEFPPKINSIRNGKNIEEEMRRDLPRLKQRLAESGLSLEDLQNNYSLPNFGQYNVIPTFPSTAQYPGTEAPRSPNRNLKKMR